MRKVQVLAFLILVIAIGLTGCSSKKEKSGAVSLYVALASAYIGDDRVESFASHLKAGLPEYNEDEKTISVAGISTGDSEVDPMTVMAGTAKVGAIMASGEVELWICDQENALRYADNGTNYVALKTLFTEEELESFGGTLIRFPKKDDDGNETGAFNEIRGLDLSQQNKAVAELIGIKDPQRFIMAGSANLDAAKAAFRFLAG